MKNISFALTTQQIKARTKDVTRRLGWLDLEPGDRLQACVKCMGLQKGQKPEKLCVIEATNWRREPLDAITQEEVVREGFPHLTPTQFIAMFCASHKGCTPQTIITRIEFKYV